MKSKSKTIIKGAKMKKVIGLLVGVGLLLTYGCAEQKPEEAARKIVDTQVKVHHEGFALDTSKVVYKVMEQDANKARVEVTGDIAVQAVIPLVMQDGEWVLDVPTGKAPAKKAHKAAPH
jgi:hypothetical protein